MHIQKVQGIAVTDNEGNLVDALSVRDLRNIRPGSKSFGSLFDSVKVRWILRACGVSVVSLGCLWGVCGELTSVGPHFQEFKESVRKDRNKSPANLVTVGKDGTLGDVMGLMTKHAVHRIFVVSEKDEKKKVLDIITMSDVMKFILQELRR